MAIMQFSTRMSDRRSQSEKFIRTARELGCDEDPEAFERAARQVVRPQKGEPVPSNQRAKRTATQRRLGSFRDPEVARWTRLRKC